MTKSALIAGLVLVLSPFALARNADACPHRPCETFYHLVSSSDLQGYGLLIAAPEVGCRRVRFRIEDDRRILGRTPSLKPGELAVVRMGRRFSRGEHLLTIAAEGCEALPAATRRVSLAKPAPDHGWRAADAQSRMARLR